MGESAKNRENRGEGLLHDIAHGKVWLPKLTYLVGVQRRRRGENYSGIPISRTLNFSNLPITRTKSSFPSSVEHCNFTPDFSNSPIFRTNFRFPWRFVKSGFHCRSKREERSEGERRERLQTRHYFCHGACMNF